MRGTGGPQGVRPVRGRVAGPYLGGWHLITPHFVVPLGLYIIVVKDNTPEQMFDVLVNKQTRAIQLSKSDDHSHWLSMDALDPNKPSEAFAIRYHLRRNHARGLKGLHSHPQITYAFDLFRDSSSELQVKQPLLEITQSTT